MHLHQIPYSVLDLALVNEGSDYSETFQKTVETAQLAEQLGYTRFWMAEHHNMPHVGSSATVVLLTYLGGKTRTIRLGSGGIMLPNHSPLIVAEQFGTLESLFPGRIDLGLGRAPGTDQLTSAAIRGNRMANVQEFPAHVSDILRYFSKDNPSAVKAYPGNGLEVPVWILGSSTDSAYLAASLGLPYSFASHFAPAQMQQAISIYRQNFQPSAYLEHPKVMLCVNVVAAETDDEAELLASSLYRMFAGVATGLSKPLQPPSQDALTDWPEELKQLVESMLACSFIGGKSRISAELQHFVEAFRPDELMVTSAIFDHAKRLKSFELFQEVMKGL